MCGALLADDKAVFCDECNKKLGNKNTTFNKMENLLIDSNPPQKKMITETKCTCSACGNVFYYGKIDKYGQGCLMAEKNCVAGSCPCFLPLAFLGNEQFKDFNKCPKCGSKAIKKEQITHEVV